MALTDVHSDDICDDSKLLNLLDDATHSTMDVPSVGSSSPLQVAILRSQPPRKDDNKKVHSVTYGKNCRVRAPSRKNIVIDAISGLSAGTTEWSADVAAATAPVFQVGNMECVMSYTLFRMRRFNLFFLFVLPFVIFDLLWRHILI